MEPIYTQPRGSHIDIACRSVCDRDQNGIKRSTFSFLILAHFHTLYTLNELSCSVYRPTIAYHLMLDAFTIYSVLSDNYMIITSYIVYHLGHMASLEFEGLL